MVLSCARPTAYAGAGGWTADHTGAGGEGCTRQNGQIEVSTKGVRKRGRGRGTQIALAAECMHGSIGRTGRG